MNDYCLVINLDRCVNCQACEIACQIKHSISPGTSRINILKNRARYEQGRVIQDYIPLVCLQCQERPCIASCRKNAIYEVDSVVVLNRDLCDGCTVCAGSCPYGMILMDKISGKAEKCDQCYDREAGLPPHCVANCWGGALMWVPQSELNPDLVGRPDGTDRQVIYLSQRREVPPADY